MQSDQFDHLVSLIYDAALDEGLWAPVVRALAKVTDCGQASFEWHDHDTGEMVRQAPLTEPSFIKSWREHYGREFNLLKRTGPFPVGRVFRTADFLDTEWMARSAYFNEWWKPQGVGGGSLFANIAMGTNTAVMTTLCKRLGENFSATEEALFAAAVRHMIRAVDITTKMRLAEMRRLPTGDGMPDGLILVGADARILAGDDQALRRLNDAGFVDRLDPNTIRTPDRAVERLVKGAARAANGDVRAGHCDYRNAVGNAFRITVFPCSSQGPISTWLTIDKPAALLQIAAPGDRRRAHVRRIAREHGLTPAEAAVALEAARGDGRAAVAARLGIRETTVRSHLTAIFDKLDIHRQAELTRLVAGD